MYPNASVFSGHEEEKSLNEIEFKKSNRLFLDSLTQNNHKYTS